jgi:hypothetical protein
MPLSERPRPIEYGAYYQRYIGLVPDGDIIQTLSAQALNTIGLFESIDEEHSLYRYGPGKWSLREVLGHMIDTERVFCYRALRFSRGDSLPLQGYDQDAYVENSDFDSRSWNDLLQEFEIVRGATIAFFSGLSETMWLRSGTADGNALSVRAVAWVLAGHELHHMRVIIDRYLA